jgi:hypothetical protein
LPIRISSAAIWMPKFSLDESLDSMPTFFTSARRKEWLLFTYDMQIHLLDSPPSWIPTFATWEGKNCLQFSCESMS